MNSFEKYFGDTYDFIEVIKSDENLFVIWALDILGENYFNGSVSISVKSQSKNIISSLHRNLEIK